MIIWLIRAMVPLTLGMGLMMAVLETARVLGLGLP
jgi:hypothetical protein